MSRRRLAWTIAGLAALAVAVALLVRPSGGARGSALSQGPGGWLAARRYLEARGVEVRLLDRPLDRFAEAGVLVVAFPWQLGGLSDPGQALDDHLRRGGDLLVAYSGGFSSPAELIVLDALAGDLDEVREPPLDPWRWRRFVREEWDLEPAALAMRPLRVWAPRVVPQVPPAAYGNTRVLFRGPGGKPAVFAFERHGGRVVMLPADVFANARLGSAEGAGNADLLETLIGELGRRWTFDEYHHGLSAPDAAESAVSGPVLDLLMVHLAILYLLAAWGLARRFGPVWREAPAVAGSTASFLVGLGALHHRLGHHREAAHLLLSRTRELDRKLVIPKALERRAAAAGEADLVGLARALVRLRRGRHREANPEISA